MAQRTSLAAVQAILGDPAVSTRIQPNWDGLTSVQPYIDKASPMVDRAVSMAATRGWSLTTAEQEIIERWLAAYYYTILDPLYKQRTTQGASGTFVRSDKNDYKQAAIESDPSGALRDLLAGGQKVFGGWLGKAPADQVDSKDRPTSSYPNGY